MHEKVFPTPVGVFPTSNKIADTFGSLPHARGGVSLPFSAINPILWSSPRPWGCFLCIICSLIFPFVFPTPVGVFL